MKQIFVGSSEEALSQAEDIVALLNSIDELDRACAPALAQLIRETESPQLILRFDTPDEQRVAEQVKAFIDLDFFKNLPSRYRKAVEHAVMLFHFHERKETVSFAPVFQPLLGPIDHASEALLLGRLSADVPADAAAQKDFFEPDMSAAKKKDLGFYGDKARLLKRLLVHRSPLMPVSVLQFCLDYAKKATEPLPGVFKSVRTGFSDLKDTGLKQLIDQCYEFRNTYVAHEKEELLTDVEETRSALQVCVDTLQALVASHG